MKRLIILLIVLSLTSTAYCATKAELFELMSHKKTTDLLEIARQVKLETLDMLQTLGNKEPSREKVEKIGSNTISLYLIMRELNRRNDME